MLIVRFYESVPRYPYLLDFLKGLQFLTCMKGIDAVYFNGANKEGAYIVTALARRPRGVFNTMLYLRVSIKLAKALRFIINLLCIVFNVRWMYLLCFVVCSCLTSGCSNFLGCPILYYSEMNINGKPKGWPLFQKNP